MNKYYYILKSAKLLKSGFRDPLFYLIFCDYVLTRVIVGFHLGVEANPIVLYLGHEGALVISFALYLIFIPKRGNNVIRIFLMVYYLFLNIHHILLIFGLNIF